KNNTVLIAVVSFLLGAVCTAWFTFPLPALFGSSDPWFGNRPPFSTSSFGHPPSFTLEFPDSADLGELWLIEHRHCFTCGTGEKNLGRATGRHSITLPAAHWFISLRMPEHASALSPFLAHPSLVNIGDIDLSRSDVKDDDLQYLTGMNLKSINLSGTRITGEGLRYLKPSMKERTFVDLRSCQNLDLRHLAHFRNWKQSFITLVGDKEYTDEEKRLLGAANRVICDSLQEHVCGVRVH
ncbi:MAG: hypothetical protein KIT18_11095, partial [Burkholderiales bacterium]|nr:hypothetical protein [Burkholderiales bacterium]